MADYYLEPALVQLRNEINAKNPNRDKSSDGWIGDASHAARVSDHNPDWSAGGVVRAIDVDKDGIDVDALYRCIKGDDRVEYFIWSDFIATRQNNFQWAAYKGIDNHRGHFHISGRAGKKYEDDTRAWGYSPGGVAVPAAGLKPLDEIADEVLAGHWGNGPQRSQSLSAAGYSPTAVQAAVNAKLGGTVVNTATKPSVAALATQVIAGQWGKNPERAQRLTAAGYDAAAVQAEVNRRLA